MEGVLRFKNGLALCQKMRDFASENAARERMWVQCGGIGLLVVHAVFRLHFTYEGTVFSLGILGQAGRLA